jgi:hypothetical protein
VPTLVEEYAALKRRHEAYERKHAAYIKNPGPNAAAILRALGSELRAYELDVARYNRKATTYRYRPAPQRFAPSPEPSVVQKAFAAQQRERTLEIEAEARRKAQRRQAEHEWYLEQQASLKAIRVRREITERADVLAKSARLAGMSPAAGRLEVLKSGRLPPLYFECQRVEKLLGATTAMELAEKAFAYAMEAGYPAHAARIRDRVRERDEEALLTTLKLVLEEIVPH